ncbi:MAG: 2-dehydropantoate 2-reductase [Proteobacteria bacterium]|nr:2-dehydropantoate 2-reductase [Pseudomonadota bacterium]NIS71652.1 2-dehydropantoate 2-reductase [Pseudomonadota bacterium]
MKIVMLGAGAMGSLFGAMLSQSEEGEVWLLDIWREHINQINSHGLIVESEGKELVYQLRATTDPDEVGVADLIIVFVKAYITKAAVEYGLSMVGEETVFLSLQNGLGNIESIKSAVRGAQVIGGVTSQGSTVLGPGRIRHGGKGPTAVGGVKGKVTPEVERISSLFNRAGIPTGVSDNIECLIWEKLLINVGINAVTAITGLKNGELLEYDETKRLMTMAVQEAERVALKKGVPVRGNPAETVLQVCKTTAQNRSSMGQDIDNRRRTEIDFINGGIVKEGEALGIPTPVNATLTYLIKTIEARFGA